MNSFIIQFGTHLESYNRACIKSGDPQYKYFILPFYRAIVGKTGDVAATALTYLAADLVVHQLASQVAKLLFRIVAKQIVPDRWAPFFGLNEPFQFKYKFKMTLAWLAFGTPVMYVKYLRNKKKSPDDDNCCEEKV